MMIEIGTTLNRFGYYITAVSVVLIFSENVFSYYLNASLSKQK